MLVRIFDCNNYRDYLEIALPTKGEDRGIRSKLAIYLDCRLSHITQVIQGQSHFGIEMAHKTAEFLKLTPEETHFFVLLVSKDRAGNKKLEKYYQDQIDEILKARSDVSHRLNLGDELGQEQIMHYYSSWHYSAIHILCSLPQIKTLNDIHKNLKLSMEQISEAVHFLIEANILRNTDQGLDTTNRRIHLGSKSKMISKHHTNWRIKAIDELSLPNPSSLHFSAAYSFAKKDWDKIRDLFLSAMKSSEELIKESPEEMVGAVCLDFFKIGNEEI